MAAACVCLAACETGSRSEPEPDSGVDASEPLRDAGSDSDAALDGGLTVAPEVGRDFLAFPALELDESGVLDLTFELPDSARSFVLTAQSSAPAYIALMALVGPDGEVLFDAENPDAAPFQPAVSYNLADPLPLSLLFAGADNQGAQPGRYRVRVGARGEESELALRLDVVWQAVQAPRSLGMNFWVARGAAFDAQGLIDDPSFRAVFAALRDIFEAAEIALEPLHAFDLGAEGSDLSQVADDNELAQLLSVLEEQPAGGLDVILVDSIQAEGRTVRGKTTAIGGPPARPELIRRGAVLLALDALPQDPRRIAEAIAHESAHYLGLRHTTEMDGSRTDDIADTPECPIELASFETASGELVLSAEDCLDYDGENLLFAMPPRGTTTQVELTEGQLEVLRSHPLLR